MQLNAASLFICLCSLVLFLAAASLSLAADAPVTPPNLDTAFFYIRLPGFFPGNDKMLKIYATRRDGKWNAAIASSNNDRGRATWNTSMYPVDMSKVETKDGRTLSGEATVSLNADPWVPKDQKPRTVKVQLTISLTPPKDAKIAVADMTGTWSSSIEGETEESLTAARLLKSAKGEITGGVGGTALPDLADESYNLSLPCLIPGTPADDNIARRKAINIGIKKGKVISARIGAIDMRQNAFDFADAEFSDDSAVAPDGHIKSTVRFSTPLLTGGIGEFAITLDAQRAATYIAGTWKGTVSADGADPKEISGFLKGTVTKGAYESAAEKDARPWFVPVAGFKPVEKGEHPRLFFRKSDLPELRRRAATPDGQLLVKRLRELLNGSDGESMPTKYNPATKAYGKSGFKSAPGAFTVAHAAGFGFLYQLTDDKKYADLARQCVEKAWEGQRNSDDRYSWVAPGGELRAGPSLAMHALAYDLCYNAWPEDFRTKVALALQNYADQKGGEWNTPEGITLKKMIFTPKQGPGSNHYGAVVGGTGIVVLAINGDPATDDALLAKYLESIERNAIRHFLAGWGDGGYYKEGWGASRVGTQGGAFLMFLQAYKNAQGKDFANAERTSASYISMVPRCLMVVGPPGSFPYRSNMGPTYGSPEVGTHDQNAGWSNGGIYSEGLGAVADRFKPALLWTYNHQIDPGNKFLFDTVSYLPHRPMMALINWPTFAGIQERNPAEVMPLATRDTMYDYFVFRNRFQDKSDVVTTVGLKLPDGTKPREIMVWGLGQRLTLGEPAKGASVTNYQAAKDGSAILAAGNWSLAVDYSKSSGADALIVTTSTVKELEKSIPGVQLKSVTLAGKPVTVLTLSANNAAPPEITVTNDTLTVGAQSITFTGASLTLKTFTPLK